MLLLYFLDGTFGRSSSAPDGSSSSEMFDSPNEETDISRCRAQWTGRGGLYLEDLFVEEEFRGKGVSKALFRHLGQECEERKLPRMEWVVIDWNDPAKEVYRRMGAKHVSLARCSLV